VLLFYQLLYHVLPWVAPVTSGAFLLLHWREGDAGRTVMAIGLGWFVLALCLQFLGHVPVVTASGLALQTLLAVILIAVWNAG